MQASDFITYLRNKVTLANQASLQTIRAKLVVTDPNSYVLTDNKLATPNYTLLSLFVVGEVPTSAVNAVVAIRYVPSSSPTNVTWTYTAPQLPAALSRIEFLYGNFRSQEEAELSRA